MWTIHGPWVMGWVKPNPTQLLTVDTQFCTHNLTLGEDQNSYKYPKIMIAFHASTHSSHIIKMILRF